MSENRKNNFGFLHLIGAIFIMCGHEFDLLKRTGPTVCGLYLSTIGVNILFLISGYLVTKSYFRKNSFIIFFRKRFIRIFPLLIITTGLLAFIVGPIISELPLNDYFSRTDSYYFFISNILLRPVFHLPGVFHTEYAGAIVNIPIWTLPIEVLGYTILAVIGLCITGKDRKKYGKMVFAMFLSIFVILYLVFDNATGYEITFWGTNWVKGIRLLAYFAFGCVTAYFSLEKYCNLQISLLLIVILQCIDLYINDVVRMFGLSYITFSFAFAEKPLFLNIQKRFDITYGIYLLGWPIQQIVIFYLFESGIIDSTMLLLTISIGLTIAAALLLEIYIDMPLRAWLEKKFLKT